MNRQRPNSRAFTLIELIAVIVVLGILAGVAVPKYFDYAANARESATRATLGTVRSAIANFYANSAIAGEATFPTIEELRALGTVMQEAIPANPYKNTQQNADVRAATWDPDNLAPSGNEGWNYDANTGRFWANSDSGEENTW